jgi:hypothetical protein
MNVDPMRDVLDSDPPALHCHILPAIDFQPLKPNPVGAKNLIHVTRLGDIHGSVRRSDLTA